MQREVAWKIHILFLHIGFKILLQDAKGTITIKTTISLRSEDLMWILSEKVTLEDVSQSNLKRQTASPERTHTYVYLVKIKILFRYIIKPFELWRLLQNIHSYKTEATKVINIVLERQTSDKCLAKSISSFSDF